VLVEPARAVDGWSIARADTAGDVGENCSLILDSSDNPRISYYDFIAQDLKYAERIGGIWSTVTIDSIGDVGRATSIALDSQGEPHIAYQDVTNLDLKYAYRTGGVWIIENVDWSANVGAYTSLVMGAGDIAHVAYYDQASQLPKYAYRYGSWNWGVEYIEFSPTRGHHISLALDTGGVPCVSYRDVNNAHLRFATRAQGFWVAETVDPVGNTGYFSSIAVDQTGTVHIAYRDVAADQLKHAYGYQLGGGPWSVEVIETALQTGRFNSLDIDSSNTPHLSYQQGVFPNTRLKYAARSGGTWTPTLVDSTGDVGYYSSLELASDDRPRICYYNNTDYDLMYAEVVTGVDNCYPTVLWRPGPSIKLTIPLSYWPTGDVLRTMAPGDVIALSVLAEDMDYLVTTCIDCLGNPLTKKWGPYADFVRYTWTQLDTVGTIFQPAGLDGNTILYQIPKCWPDLITPRTSTISLVISNAIGKASDIPIVYTAEISMLNSCGSPSPGGLKVTVTISDGFTSPDQAVGEGGSGTCVPQPPPWVVGSPLQPSAITVTDPPELCPDYLTLVSVVSSDFDNFISTCVDPNPQCFPLSLDPPAPDPIRCTWEIVSGFGEFPLGNNGTAVVFRRSRLQPAHIRCTIEDSGTQYVDVELTAETVITKSKKAKALVAVGDRSSTYWGIPVKLSAPLDAAGVAKAKYEAAGYEVDFKPAAILGNVVADLSTLCYQAVWISGHAGSGAMTLQGGTYFNPIDISLGTYALGCPITNSHPYLRELVLLGCNSAHVDWFTRTLCTKVIAFTFELYSDMFGLGLHGSRDPYVWERDFHVPVPPHDLSLP